MALVEQGQLEAAVSDLESQDYEKVCAALSVLAHAGDSAKSHFGKVLDMAKGSSNLLVKRAAMEAVGKLGASDASQATPVLESGLTSADPGVRRVAAQGLGLLRAEGSVAKLSPLLLDSHMLVRNAAMAALSALGTTAASEAGTVAGNLRAPLLREDAIRALGKMGKEGAAHAEKMAIYLEDSDHNVRLAVAEALRDMGDLVPSTVVEKAGDMLDHQQDRYRATAALAVGSCGMEKSGKYVARLRKMLRENVISFAPLLLAPNCAAAVALGRLGTEGDLLAGYLQSKSPRMRTAVCQGIADMGKAGVSHANAIAKCLEDEEAGVRQAALAALKNLQQQGSLDSNVVSAMGALQASN